MAQKDVLGILSHVCFSYHIDGTYRKLDADKKQKTIKMNSRYINIQTLSPSSQFR